ncbi:hypothetical protein [Amycolatopsis sp. FDAARGOS 1241]|uniref:hypothetical protein n=1 Tax=Amycolatopsis sp. FDAARGOS 1241 TaxID=2778070 RepID=UPI0019517EA0|nr:hypothetical protein [Amycolatopsis sp. FDAARGOS 1241]QRP45185.1 hypothetical protein I6J71_39415 [Amycolatopsis sp. FDAARGOS 1241]
MRKRAVFVAAVAIGTVAVAGQAVAATGGPAAAPAQPAPAVTVQLNQDTAVLHGMVDKYQRGEANVALADCPGAKAGSTTFSSPVLTFASYDFGPFIGVQATVSARAELAPGTAAGAYPLTVSCGGKTYSTTFSVPAAQVAEVPSGAAKAGDGSLAE